MAFSRVLLKAILFSKFRSVLSKLNFSNNGNWIHDLLFHAKRKNNCFASLQSLLYRTMENIKKVQKKTHDQEGTDLIEKTFKYCHLSLFCWQYQMQQLPMDLWWTLFHKNHNDSYLMVLVILNKSIKVFIVLCFIKWTLKSWLIYTIIYCVNRLVLFFSTRLFFQHLVQVWSNL